LAARQADERREQSAERSRQEAQRVASQALGACVEGLWQKSVDASQLSDAIQCLWVFEDREGGQARVKGPDLSSLCERLEGLGRVRGGQLLVAQRHLSEIPKGAIDLSKEMAVRRKVEGLKEESLESLQSLQQELRGLAGRGKRAQAAGEGEMECLREVASGLDGEQGLLIECKDEEGSAREVMCLCVSHTPGLSRPTADGEEREHASFGLGCTGKDEGLEWVAWREGVSVVGDERRAEGPSIVAQDRELAPILERLESLYDEHLEAEGWERDESSGEPPAPEDVGAFLAGSDLVIAR
jgi:hypothetical protein